MPGIEPGASRSRTERSTDELHPASGTNLAVFPNDFPLRIVKSELLSQRFYASQFIKRIAPLQILPEFDRKDFLILIQLVLKYNRAPIAQRIEQTRPKGEMMVQFRLGVQEKFLIQGLNISEEV